jgi:hypothetical protein
MTGKGKKLEPQLGLDMPFDEAMNRFMQTDPREVEANIARSKQNKPPGSKKKKKKTTGSKKAAALADGQIVVSLRDRRMRKRNYGR